MSFVSRADSVVSALDLIRVRVDLIRVSRVDLIRTGSANPSPNPNPR